MMQWLRLLDDQTDPVKHCDLYRDKEAGSCAHVDGPLCDFQGCSMLRDYRESKLATDGVVTGDGSGQALPPLPESAYPPGATPLSAAGVLPTDGGQP